MLGSVRSPTSSSWIGNLSGQFSPELAFADESGSISISYHSLTKKYFSVEHVSKFLCLASCIFKPCII